MRTLICLFLLSTTAFANACLSSGTGNWNDSSKWTGCGGGVPSNGDAVTIGNGHTVTIPAGYTAVVGTSTSGAAIKCTTNAGTGILAVNGTLTFRGDVEQCNNTWTVGPDAVLEHDSSLASSPSTTHYKWTIGMATAPVTAILQIRGTNGHRATVRSVSTNSAGAFYGFGRVDNDRQGAGQFDFEYVNIDRCGGATPCTNTNSYSSAVSSLARCDHCSVTNSGHFLIWVIGTSQGPLNVVRITNSTFTATADADRVVVRANIYGSGDAVFDTIYTDGVIDLNSPAGGYASGLRVRKVFARSNDNTVGGMTLGGGHFRVAEFDLFLRISDLETSGVFTYIPGGNITRLMGLVKGEYPHTFSGPNGDWVTEDVIDGGWFERLGTTMAGYALNTSTAGAELTTIKNTISPCAVATGYGLALSSNLILASGYLKTFSLQNNTYCGKYDTGGGVSFARMFGTGGNSPTDAAPAGMVTSLKNNLVFCASACEGYLVHEGQQGLESVGSYQNVDYNWKWNITTGPYSQRIANPYSAYSPNPPGAHDPTGDPQFVQQRHFLEWGQMLDPTINTWTEIVAKFAKMNDDTGYDSRFTIQAAYDWLRAGYAPQNAAVMTAGDTGGRVGAMDAPTGGGSSSPTSGIAGRARFSGSGRVSGRVGSASAGGGGSVTASAGASNTQYLLQYTAPSTSPCTVQVSESATYSPLVHDVNATLFSGANQDDRAGSLGAGTTTRVVVIGKRFVELAADGKNYSRALQASTTHYWRACAGWTASGTFTTSNIPFNSTYQDVPQLGPDRFAISPTLSSTDRTQKIVEPYTGALIRRVSLPSDTGYPGSSGNTGPYMYSGGFIRVCSNSLMGSPAIGFLCSFASGGGGYAVLYYLIPSTGEARYLGYFPVAYAYINQSNGKFYMMDGSNQINVVEYTGDYQPKTANTQASYSANVLLAGNINDEIHAFNTNFVTAAFGCALGQVTGNYATFSCKRGNQDSYGWVAVFDLTTNHIVAAAQTYQNIKSRWSGLHAIYPLYDQPILAIEMHDLNNYGCGTGPYSVTTTASLASSSGDTTVSVSGEPVTPACTDAYLSLAQIGDVLRFQDGEQVQITAKASANSWTVTRGYAGSTIGSHSSGAVINTYGLFSNIFWNFLDDPNGTDTTGTYYREDPNWPKGGHDDVTTGLMITESGGGWYIRTGALSTQVGTPLTREISGSTSFAGVQAQCYGAACTIHPSVSPAGSQPWISDFWQFGGGGFAATPGIVQVSGQLYRYTSNPALTPLSRKHFATATVAGSRWTSDGPLGFVDISGPSSVIGAASGDGGKYCVVNFAGECHTREGGGTSQVGDIFVNAPSSSTLTVGCTLDGPCITNFGGLMNGVLQLGTAGTMNRVISAGGFSGLRDGSDYPNAKSLADGSYLLWSHGSVSYASAQPSQLLMAKLPPFTVDDAVDRTTFVRAPISITTPGSLGIATATVEFGYAEQGTPGQHYCTSRREACVGVASTVTDATPFWFANTDTYTRAACASSCTITLPVLPGHVAYWQVKFYDGAGAFVQNGKSGVALESTVAAR